MSALVLIAMLVVPVEGKPFEGDLEAIAADGTVTFRLAASEVAAATGQRTVDHRNLVRWSHPKPLQPQPLVVLADGSRLVTAADWSGEAPVQIVGDSITVRSDSWSEARLDRSQVRGLVFAERSHPRDRLQLENEVRAASGKQDEALLANQDRLAGTVKKLAAGTLTLATEAGDVELPLSRVEAVIFANERPTGDSIPRARMIVGLRDGSLLYANSVEANDAGARLETTGGVRLTGGVRDDFVALQVLDGDFVYLSDLEPANYRHVPYLEIAWPYERDRNLQGEPLRIGGKIYLKGIAMHSAARLSYSLDGTFRRFDSDVALDDSTGNGGSVTFAVYLLRDGKWQAEFQSGVVRGGEQPRRVSVDLTGAAAITLTVDYADRGDELDHADWLDARLVK